MKNPFVLPNLSRKIKFAKNLGFEEALMGTVTKDAEILDDKRDTLNYRSLFIIIIIGLSLLLSRTIYLQVVKGSEYRALAEGNKLRAQYILAPRGQLLDREGLVLVGNMPSFELAVVTSDLSTDKTEFDGRLTQVGSILGKDPSFLLDIIRQMTKDAFQAQTLAQNITKDQALILMAKASDLKGFVVQNNPIRHYKDPLVFAHLTGYTGKITTAELEENQDQDYALNDYIGKNGIEFAYEEKLRGVAGKQQAEVDAQGLFKKALQEIPARPGSDVKLNIDYDLQKVIYDSLLKVMGKRGLKRAAAIATSPQTGEVLALLSLPSFDSNLFARGITQDEFNKIINDPNQPLLDRVISGTYPPGSTIKPVMAIAGLSEGIVTPQTKILDDGVIRVGIYNFYGYEREGLGLMDIYSAIARSSDIYFYTLGGGNPKSVVKQGLGPDKIATWFRKFNLGSPLEIDLPSEKSGLVPDPDWKERVKKENWFLGDTYHESIGQGDVLATPLQVNSWTATIANGGRVLRPYLLHQDSGGQPKVIAENIIDPSYIQVVQDAMRQAVTLGSARSLLDLPIEVSGKTGTAQFDARDLRRTHAWFTSYAPSSNPQIALTILVEAGGEGYAVAVPVAKEVYQWWAENRMK